MRWRPLLLRTLAPLALAATAWLALPGTMGNYLARAGIGQLELLADRQPIDQVLQTERFAGVERDRLAQVQRIKDFGLALGLSPSGSYSAISPNWDRTIWNVSACHPTRFRNRTWWFPIVGRVPYLGYFDEGLARSQAATLQRRGYDVHVRTAGAYSTLGWFDDPVLPNMLKTSESDLANTILHELTHATLWVPGSVAFNESLASFVGDVSAERYMVHTYGAESPEVRQALRVRERRLALREVLHGVYQDLYTLYARKDLTEAEKRNEKARLLATIPLRVARLDLPGGEKVVAWAQREEWNNARLLQFKTYNKRQAWFQALLDSSDGDLPTFLSSLEKITRGSDDPSAALARAVGAEPESPEKSVLKF